MDKGYSLDEAEKNAPVLLEAQDMLRKWEAGDKETLELWNKMNGWVYTGFDETYNRLGIGFDRIDYESQTYLLGKEIIQKGLSDGILFKKSDGSVWIDLKEEGLDEKVLLRSDGTSVYMTQDIGTAVKRHEEFGFGKLIYVVGNEQDYHFKVLFKALKKLGYDWADSLYHLSYNMVDLPSGKMKSREGTVVDADELIEEITGEAKRLTLELGKLEDTETKEARELFDMLGMGALKYFILKVDPEKRMLFNPNESIDFNGNTGPFIQYTHARLQSVMRKALTIPSLKEFENYSPEGYDQMIPKEKEIVRQLVRYPETVIEAGNRLSPALLANYTYELARIYNQFYHDNVIADSTDINRSLFRLYLCRNCAEVIRQSMHLLGIGVPDRM
jgi:arginyl-tRNA synthetase